MPTATVPKPLVEEDEVKGINAVLLGPPGSGKGTQVQIRHICRSSCILLNYRHLSSNNVFVSVTYPPVTC